MAWQIDSFRKNWVLKSTWYIFWVPLIILFFNFHNTFFSTFPSPQTFDLSVSLFTQSRQFTEKIDNVRGNFPQTPSPKFANLPAPTTFSRLPSLQSQWRRCSMALCLAYIKWSTNIYWINEIITVWKFHAKKWKPSVVLGNW